MIDQYAPGDHVKSTLNAGIVAASYLASLCGCLLTIEILYRRGTAIKNWRSWLETILSAISLGLVGTWCMHFIGNRAIILGDGSPNIQLVYGSGFTILSAFLPIIVLIAAFAIAETTWRDRFGHSTFLICAGILAGLSMVGMHYIGNFGIMNYYKSYRAPYLAASFVIAIPSSVIVLVLFYTLRESWICDWWKRVFCAMILAGAITAMHFTATRGARYEFRHFNTETQMKSRNTQVYVAGSICVLASLLLVCYMVFTYLKDQRLKGTSQKIMLASVMFDPSGRILVTTDGVLPSREITDKYIHRTFDEEFDTAHPVFQWVFQVTHDWAAVRKLVPNMKKHINAQKGSNGESPSSSSQSSAIYDSETYTNYGLLFKERFCIAAAAIASSLHLDLMDIGVLYDRIIETGTLRPEDKTSRRNTTIEERRTSDIEAAMSVHVFGKGQLMFVTKTVTREEADNLLNAGLKFAIVQQVSRTISYALQIPVMAVETHLAELKQYLGSLQITDKSGTWLSFYVPIPKLSRDFDIIVKRDYQAQLPDVQLLPDQPQPWQKSFLEKLDGLNAALILSELDERTSTNRVPAREVSFADNLQQAIKTLLRPFPPTWVRTAKFCSRQVFAHYNQPLLPKSAMTTIYAFTVFGDMHASLEGLDTVTRVPREFLDIRHRCYAGSPYNIEFQHLILSTFNPLFASAKVKETRRKKFSIPSLGKGKVVAKRKKSYSGSQPASRTDSGVSLDDQCSTYELAKEPVHSLKSSQGSERYQPSPIGGILVNSETVINRDDKDGRASNSPDASLSIGTTVNVEAIKPEVTFVEELFQATKARHPRVRDGFFVGLDLPPR